MSLLQIWQSCCCIINTRASGKAKKSGDMCDSFDQFNLQTIPDPLECWGCSSKCKFPSECPSITDIRIRIRNEDLRLLAIVGPCISWDSSNLTFLWCPYFFLWSTLLEWDRSHFWTSLIVSWFYSRDFSDFKWLTIECFWTDLDVYKMNEDSWSTFAKPPCFWRT